MSRPPVQRLIALFCAFAFAMAMIIVRLVFLQVHDAKAYQAMGTEQRIHPVPLPATRGAILDRTGRELALSLEARAIYADMRYVEDPASTAWAIAPIIDVRPMELQRLMMSTDGFVYLARQVDRPLAQEVADLELPGIGLLEESKRYYPSGPWGAPQIVGMTGIDGQGLGGLELAFDEQLSGTPGEQRQEIDPAGRPIPQGQRILRPAVPGQDVVTTIDPQLQYQAQLAIEDAVERNGAKGGTVVMMNPRTGEILALATYYPSGKKHETIDRTTNPAVTNVYEPGSVNKVITAAGAIEERAVGLNDVFHVPDRITAYEYTIHDAESHGVWRMKIGDIIAHSSNVGTIFLAKELGEEHMASYLAKFGYGQETGVGLPGESPGILPALYEWSGVSMYNLPIGQGVSVTPIQMVNVYATIANGGVWTQPRLVTALVDADGTRHPLPPPERRRVVSEATARTVTGMLAKVVTEGTGTNAEIPGYWVAGKTGTGKVPNPEGGGYINKYVASFIGFLPAGDPQVVIGVIVDQPTAQIYGGLVAAPVFQQLGKQAIARLRIPPAERPDLPPMAMRGG